MASPDVFLSSPTRERRRLYETMSSSPGLPSIQELASQKPRRPPLRSGSKAAPIPDDAPTAFTSAGCLWRSLQQADAVAKSGSAVRAPAPEEVEDADTLVATAKPTETAPKTRKPRRRKQPKPTAVVAEMAQLNGPESPSKSHPWKKYKSPSKERASPPIIQLSKSGTEVTSSQDDGRKTSPFFIVDKGTESVRPVPIVELLDEAPETIQVQGRLEAVEQPADMQGDARKTSKSRSKAKTKSKAVCRQADDEPLQLEQAMGRRLDWTPPAKTTQIVLDSDSPSLEGTTHGSQSGVPKDLSFGSLLATFKCEEIAQQLANSTSEEESGFLKKRKLLEFVSAPAQAASEAEPPTVSPVKQKAPKKKPRTITALATAAYRPLTQPEPPAAVEAKANGEPSKAVDSKGKAKAKPRKRAPKSSKKKPPPPKPILLSPGTALKQVAGQDFVFGTSSQLAREQSPSLLRDLQTAMKSTNHLDHVDFVTPLNSDAIEPAEKHQSLWDAAARDADGDLFDVEVLNLVNGSQRLPGGATEEDPFGYIKGDERPVDLPPLPAAPTDNNMAMDDDSFLTLSDILPALVKKPVEVIDISHQSSRSQSSGDAEEEALRAPQELARGQTGSITHVITKTTTAAMEAGEAERPPSYDNLSDAQLANQLAQYGFRPVKKRGAMIALLQQCWRPGTHGQPGATRLASTTSKGSPRCVAKTPTAGGSSAFKAVVTPEKRGRGRPRKTSSPEQPMQEPPPSAQPQATPKRRRGRPRKGSDSGPFTPKGASKRTVIEIPDSEADAGVDSSDTPSSSPGAMFSPPQPVDLILSIDEETELSLTISPTDQQTELFSYVTKAVTTAPRTTDPANPSWHEKMLLYDPIVIEDLTAWLNCGQLTRVGYDGEVSGAEVKTWCESKSICCLWKVNLRGKERKRY
ncbi:5'-flap endonuclease [Purpureocillium takamizusanense]|uniref:Structure-specific endonuclease subunit SLX4 n=1 Tax=Purpureocillium takamizusanense TaxID=2060973 RepID=A0A9Q8VF52_9HYPO|nr:5'-flap endonuclease [Purpureocillium takamizusanense]UNI23298.1 5'-flap endonuclease [Purpureocillium takamizusanense]